MSSKYRYNPRVKEAVASIKGNSQQLWSKSERDVDEDLYHCNWNSKMTEDKQGNTESEGVFEYGKSISNHSQHWKGESDLDGDLYDAVTCTKPSRQHQATRISNKVTWLLREQLFEEVIKARRSFVHPSSLVRIFEDYQLGQSGFEIQVRIIGPPSVGYSFVHLSSFLDQFFEDSEAKGFQKLGNEYYKSYYLKLSPSTLSVKLTLLSTEEFESLTYKHGPHKTHFRPKLLFSPSYLPPGGRKSFCFHQIPSDNLDVIDDNGHFGCGFIHPAYLVQLIGSSQPAQSVLAIQVRIIGPFSAGVTNSVLFKDKTMEEYKIQLP
jgi:hypothetical protein